MTVRTPNNNYISVVNVRDGRSERWTFEESEDETPIWSDDGRELVYSAAHTGRARHIFRIAAPGGLDSVFTASGHMHLTSWSPDGEWLLAYQADPVTADDVWLIKADGTEATPVLNEQFGEWNATFSPDGNWVIYQSNQTGTSELYVRSFPDFGPRRQITTGGGVAPKWAPEVGELIYGVPDTDTLKALKYTLDGGFNTEPATTVFEFPGLRLRRVVGWPALRDPGGQSGSTGEGDPGDPELLRGTEAPGAQLKPQIPWLRVFVEGVVIDSVVRGSVIQRDDAVDRPP